MEIEGLIVVPQDQSFFTKNVQANILGAEPRLGYVIQTPRLLTTSWQGALFLPQNEYKQTESSLTIHD